VVDYPFRGGGCECLINGDRITGPTPAGYQGYLALGKYWHPGGASDWWQPDHLPDFQGEDLLYLLGATHPALLETTDTIRLRKLPTCTSIQAVISCYLSIEDWSHHPHLPKTCQYAVDKGTSIYLSMLKVRTLCPHLLLLNGLTDCWNLGLLSMPIQAPNNCQRPVRGTVYGNKSQPQPQSTALITSFLDWLLRWSHCTWSCFSAIITTRYQRCWITNNQNNGISPQKHFTDVSILVDDRASFLSLSTFGCFGPRFLNVFQ